MCDLGFVLSDLGAVNIDKLHKQPDMASRCEEALTTDACYIDDDDDDDDLC